MSRAYYYSSTGGITGSTDIGMAQRCAQPGIAGTPYWKMRSDDAESHCAEKQQSNCPRAMCLNALIRSDYEQDGEAIFSKSAKHPISNLHSNYGVLAITRHFDDDYQLAIGSRLALTLAIKGISNTTQRA